jgi:hypothetical protein
MQTFETPENGVTGGIIKVCLWPSFLAILVIPAILAI